MFINASIWTRNPPIFRAVWVATSGRLSDEGKATILKQATKLLPLCWVRGDGAFNAVEPALQRLMNQRV